MGRSSIDLYSADVGSPFVDINNFTAYVGGSPTNISVGVKRLGLKSALLTAVGKDPVGDFILNFLNNEGVETGFIPHRIDRRTSAVVLGIEPPDKFPLVYYRDNCADISLTIDDVLSAPINDCKVFQFAGTNLSAEPSRSSTMFAVELAKKSGAKVVLDVDFRPDQWHDIRAFGVSIRAVLPLVDVVIGTEDEINAAMLVDKSEMALTHSQISDTKVRGNSRQNIAKILENKVEAVIEKVGPEGANVHLPDGQSINVPGFPVEIYNILGAGDAFGAGFIYGYIHNWDWVECTRLGNACGAWVVTKHGCANFMPTMDELAILGYSANS